MEFKDLTSPEVQGSFGHDRLDLLKDPGYYKLPIRSYCDKSGKFVRNIAVRVVAVYDKDGTQCIVITDCEANYDYPFYYNGNERCFKPNFEVPDYQEVLEMIDFETEDRNSEES